MSMLPIKPKVYNDGRTKQSFKKSTDINEILKRAQKTGTISHLSKYGAQYGDFSDFDFQTAQNQLAQAKQIFDELPSEIRRDFNHNPSEFFQFANDPANVDRLAEVLPQVAEPGRYFPDVIKTAATQPPEAPQGPEEAPPIGEPQTPTEPDSPA